MVSLGNGDAAFRAVLEVAVAVVALVEGDNPSSVDACQLGRDPAADDPLDSPSPSVRRYGHPPPGESHTRGSRIKPRRSASATQLPKPDADLRLVASVSSPLLSGALSRR